jgi:predicted dehydrogenase
MRLITGTHPALGSPARVGLLGAGGIAPMHAETLSRMPGIQLVGVADIDPFRAKSLAQRWGAAASFSSLDEMLATAKPDVVHVLLPPERHAAPVVQSLAGGAHVFVEKPMCISATECRDIEVASARYGRTVAVNHNVTFQPTFLRLIDVIRQRRLGAVQHVSVFWSVPFGLNTFGAPLFRSQGPGAVILETGPHPLSLVVRLLGEARSASALVSAETQVHPDTWQVSLNCERGTAQCFIAIGRPFMEMRVHVVGEDGSATADLVLGTVTVSENTRYSALFYQFAEGLELARSIGTSAVRGLYDRLRRIPEGGACDDAGLIMRRSIGSFYEALRNGTQPPASMNEGLAVVRSCLRIIEAGQSTLEPIKEETWETATACS